MLTEGAASAYDHNVELPSLSPKYKIKGVLMLMRTTILA